MTDFSWAQWMVTLREAPGAVLLVWVPNLVSQHTFSVQWCHSCVVVSVCLVTSQEKLEQVWSAATTRFVSNYCMKTQVWLDESGVGVLAGVPSLFRKDCTRESLLKLRFISSLHVCFECMLHVHETCVVIKCNPGWKRCKYTCTQNLCKKLLWKNEQK